MTNPSRHQADSWLSGGGVMGELIRSRDWSTSCLGEPAHWPQSLKMTIRMMLTTRHPVFIFWGRELTCFYNDAYSQSIGPERHPRALGAPGREVWGEIWDIIGPQIDMVMAGEGATWHENHLVPITRHGRRENVYWTYSYGPIDDPEAHNGVGGVLVLCSETTIQVLQEKALRASQENYRSLFESIDQGYCVLEILLDDGIKPADYRFLQINPNFARLTGLPTDAVGKTALELVPDLERYWIETYGAVALSGQAKRFEHESVPMGRWFDVYAHRIGDAADHRVGLLFSNITERKRRELNAAFLDRISKELARLETPDEIMEKVGALTGEFLRVSGCIFVDVDDTEKTVTVHHGWTSSDVPGLKQTFRLDDYLTEQLILSARAGETLIVGHTQSDARTNARSYADLKIGAFVAVPFFWRGRWVGYVAVTNAEPRDWREDEVVLLQELSNRLFSRVMRARAEMAARESEKRFRHMADNAPVMIWMTEADGTCVFLSKSWYEFTGQTPETGLGMGWLDAVHPDDRPEAEALFHSATHNQQGFRLEYRLRRADGEYIWAIDAAAPRLDERGAFLGYIGSVIDISDRKRAEETQRLLMGELNHRVKNTLTSVQAIAQQTLRRSRDPEEFVSSFSGRIQSLSRAHGLLSAGTWQGADLERLIYDQVLHGPVDEKMVKLRGPHVMVGPQTALHLALMIHELATNSCKYGALSNAKGTVDIHWRLDGMTLHLDWSERDGPRPPSAGRRGFGTVLIEKSAESEGGEARMVIEEHGISWNIHLPLKELNMLRPGTAQASAKGIFAPTRQPLSSGAKLAGKRILVVEDEALLALNAVMMLEDVGAVVADPAGSCAAAIKRINDQDFDVAILDANLGGESVDEVAAALVRRKIPFLFVTGYGRESLPPAFSQAPLLTKPFNDIQLVDAVLLLLAQPSGLRLQG